MPRCFPDSLDAGAPKSEQRVFDLLVDALPNVWCLFPGVRNLIPASEGSDFHENESDFLLFVPGRGYLVLEVKGGGITRDDQGWYSRDRHGQQHRIKHPGRQAQANAHGIKRYLDAHPQYRNGGRPRYGFGVVLPDCEADGVISPDLPRALLLDRSDLEPEALIQRLEQLMDAAGLHRRAPTPREADNFVRAVAPKLDLTPSLADTVRVDEPRLLRLTQEQCGILDTLDGNARVGIRGGAGTGKTIVAMERARRLTEAGRRVLLLCFNRPLAEHLAERGEGFTVATFHDLSRRFSEKTGIPWQPPEDAAEQKDFWQEKTAELLLDALELDPTQCFDDVIVDEGQDFKELWWTAVEALLQDSKQGSLWIFYDPNQNLYGGDPVEALNLVRANLRQNCRNTRAIAAYLADLIPDSSIPSDSAPEGMAVESIRCKDDDTMAKQLGQSLQKLVHDGGLAPDQIAVLSPWSESNSRLFQRGTFGTLRLVPLEAPPSHDSVRFSTLHRFKGLEADAVVLVELDKTSPHCSPRHIYVGASRAKHILVVLNRAVSTDR